MKIIRSNYLPREKELHLEFSDGVVIWYDDVNKRDVDAKMAEAMHDHAKRKQKKDEI